MNRLIREGEASREVADVQARLRGLGFDISDDHSHFGPSTRSAVRAFQQRRGIIVDGVVGPDTWSHLVEASWRLGDRVLYLKRPFMRGDDVMLLQRRLNALGFDAGREDGIFGNETADAVRAFQREYQVAEDAIYGPATHFSLQGLRVDRPGTTAALREELRRASRSAVRDAVVVLDPGHGADDEGAVGPNGTREADTCWDVAQRCAQRLLSWGAHVRFSRTEAEGPDVSERARRANELGADIVVSLHLNAHDEGHAEGSSAFHFWSSAAGAALADAIQVELVRLGLTDCRTHGVSYPILRETRMPAVLLEPLFVTNDDEEKLLNDDGFRSALADAIARGVRAYFEDPPD